MNSVPIVVIGAGPAGLSAAIEAAKAGAKVLVIDENLKPGGQLFKQIHKFFGSSIHRAGVRGVDIGKQLLEETEKLGIEVWLDTEVCGIDKDRNIWAIRNKRMSMNVHAEKIIIASGAIENSVKFVGWTLPGVMGAGAAQTMINTHRVLPGKKVVMIGSGNVGVIVSYQLMQAGADVVGIIEASPKLGGYGVHTAKVRRAGVPFYISHTINRAIGDHCVEGAEIIALDDKWNPIPGMEKTLEADTICVATGLTPLMELAWTAGCRFTYIPVLGGHVPVHDDQMESTVKGIYIAGDITGVEEASTAMEEGRLAGISAAADLGFYSPEEKKNRSNEIWQNLNDLRCGQFGEKRKDAKECILDLGRGYNYE